MTRTIKLTEAKCIICDTEQNIEMHASYQGTKIPTRDERTLSDDEKSEQDSSTTM